MTTEINEARFTIEGMPSEDPATGNRGFVATNSQTLTVALEANPSPALSVLYEVYDPSDSDSPLASKDAPDLTWLVSGSAKQTLTSPNDSATITMPTTGTHSYIIRATVSLASGPKSFERLVAIKKTSVTPNLRKTVPSESEQYANRGWSDDFNDLVESVGSGTGGLLSTDDTYDAFGSSPAIVHVDGAEGQGDLVHDIVGEHFVTFDFSNANDPSGGNGWTIPYGVKFIGGRDDFYIGKRVADEIAIRGHIGDVQLFASEFIEINTDGTLNLQGTGIDQCNWGPSTAFTIDYDYLGDGSTSFRVNQHGVTKFRVNRYGHTVIDDLIELPDGSASIPSLRWHDFPTNGLFRPSAWGDAVGIAVNSEAGLIVQYNTLANAPTTNVYNNSGQSYLFQVTTNAHGSGVDIATHGFFGMNSTAGNYMFAGIIGHCVDDTASSEVGKLDFFTSVSGVFASRMSIQENVVIGSGSLGVGEPAPSSSIDVAGDIEVGSSNWHYWGDPSTDSSWRLGRSGNDMVLERRESSVWVNKQTFVA
ncbi:MAG: hypothetical protein GY854_02160 [Deltaproteobacteria bacterium]|nr:hypothetical protein [Deltaproteobacteria bacterium]